MHNIIHVLQVWCALVLATGAGVVAARALLSVVSGRKIRESRETLFPHKPSSSPRSPVAAVMFVNGGGYSPAPVVVSERGSVRPRPSRAARAALSRTLMGVVAPVPRPKCFAAAGTPRPWERVSEPAPAPAPVPVPVKGGVRFGRARRARMEMFGMEAA